MAMDNEGRIVPASVTFRALNVRINTLVIEKEAAENERDNLREEVTRLRAGLQKIVEAEYSNVDMVQADAERILDNEDIPRR